VDQRRFFAHLLPERSLRPNQKWRVPSQPSLYAPRQWHANQSARFIGPPCHAAESLDNPPLLVVCDLDRFEIHATSPAQGIKTGKKVRAFDLAGLAEPKQLDLRRLFTEPESLRPGLTSRVARSESVCRGLRSRRCCPNGRIHSMKGSKDE
jgi:hypothetical protein